MSYYNFDWYYTAGPDDSDDDEEEAIAASEQHWEYDRDEELLHD